MSFKLSHCQTRSVQNRPTLLPYLLPFALFASLFALVPLIESLPAFSTGPFAEKAEHIVYPLQTVACGAAVLFFWRRYEMGRVAKPLMTSCIAVLALLIWVGPTLMPGAAPRTDGFDPEAFGDSGPIYWLVLGFRLLRLAVVVPLVEEIFWRGFLQRYLIKEDFQSVPFGMYSHLSFFGVAVAFTLVHNPPDYPAAFACGLLYGWIGCRTKSLASCIFAHGITNLLLGLFILETRQWGFW